MVEGGHGNSHITSLGHHKFRFKRWHLCEQGKSEGFDSCDRPSNVTQIGFKSSNILARVTLKFDGWPRKTIGQLFYTTSRFVHHFRDIGEFKLELQSGKFSIRVKIGDVLPAWPRNLTDDLEKRAPLPYYIKLCALFQSHQLIKNGVTVQKRSIRVKIGVFCPVWLWTLMDHLEKTIGQPFYGTSSFMHHFIAICKLKLELQ